MTITPVILAGGRGTRLWPMSRSDKPKQFLPMHGDHSLFQKTVLRHSDMPVAAPWVICGEADKFQVSDGLDAIGVDGATIVTEPMARNTAPAIAAVAELMVRQDPEAVLLVLPSDHLITPDDAYYDTLKAAFADAASGKMVTFGIVPTFPETGYGYIKGAATSGPVRPVEQFVEKPPLEEAGKMVADGNFYWNAGFFAFGARALLDELAKTAPDVAAAAKAAADNVSKNGSGMALPADEFGAAPDISIDYALLERTDKASVAPISCRWSDVGSWRAYWDTLDKDEAGNAVRGNGRVVDANNNLIVSDKAEVVALGVKDLAVVATTDSVLVCPLDKAQDVKKVVTQLKEDARSDLLDVSPTVLRPWGGYTSLIQGARFQVKHIFVHQGKKLSLQKHFHRAEHWTVVAGTAEVTIDDKVVMLSENESIYLPLGCVHRLANPGKVRLEIIEVQNGSYLGEDDIVRIEDDWGRS